MNRRELLKTQRPERLACGPRHGSSRNSAVRHLTDKIAVLDGGGANVVAFSAGDGLVWWTAALRNPSPAPSKVQTLFNTHYHIDQTGNNEMFAAAGAKIIAHDRTRQWMSTDYWVPAEDRYEKARPKAARPTEVFETTGSLQGGSGADRLRLPGLGSHQRRHLCPLQEFECSCGGRRRIARARSRARLVYRRLDRRPRGRDGYLLKLANDQTKIVPAYGPVMTRTEFKAERDMMDEVRARLFTQVREGEGPKDMLEAGVLKGLPRTWKDPYKFCMTQPKVYGLIMTRSTPMSFNRLTGQESRVPRA